MSPEAGELDQRFLVLEQGARRDGYGLPDGDSLPWVETVWGWGKLTTGGAKVSELDEGTAPRSVTEAKGFSTVSDFRFLSYYVEKLTEKSRLRIGGKDYYVVGVSHDPAPRPRWTVAYVSRVT